MRIIVKIPVSAIGALSRKCCGRASKVPGCEADRFPAIAKVIESGRFSAPLAEHF
jgi:hypothetical protein